MSTLVIETSDGIRSIAINKPAKRNSLSADTLQELSTALEDADKDPDVRVILIRPSSRPDLISRKLLPAIRSAPALITQDTSSRWPTM